MAKQKISHWIFLTFRFILVPSFSFLVVSSAGIIEIERNTSFTISNLLATNRRTFLKTLKCIFLPLTIFRYLDRDEIFLHNFPSQQISTRENAFDLILILCSVMKWFQFTLKRDSRLVFYVFQCHKLVKL